MNGDGDARCATIMVDAFEANDDGRGEGGDGLQFATATDWCDYLLAMLYTMLWLWLSYGVSGLYNADAHMW